MKFTWRWRAILVNFQVENGTYVVPKVLERGYLALGAQKLEFQARETKGR